MSLRTILGLGETGLTDYEIMAKISDARKRNLDEVDFINADGSITKIFIPSMPNFDMSMDLGS
jgi:hypothetical protein